MWEVLMLRGIISAVKESEAVTRGREEESQLLLWVVVKLVAHVCDPSQKTILHAAMASTFR